MTSPGRNDPCPCGSGRKYKHCCLAKTPAPAPGSTRSAADNRQAALMLQQALEHHASGSLQQAEGLYRRILQVSPRNADVWNNLGGIFAATGRVGEAASAFQSALAANPQYSEAHNNLGAALFNMGRVDEAVAHYRRALAIRPNDADANKNLADALSERGEIDEAERCYLRSLAARPDYAEAHHNLAGMLYKAGRHAESLASYQRALALAPGDGVARHMIAALAGEQVDHAPAQYVENVFDGYAPTFDTHLAEELNYRVPAQIAALVREFAPAASDILDLGCGTGLVGAALAAAGTRLTGVDLSAKMLEQAHAKNAYAKLVKADLVAMMREQPAASFDAITCADVFIYVGKIDDTAAEARRLLRKGGIFVFSVEDLGAVAGGAERDFALLPSGRFAHGGGYLAAVARACGFDVHAVQPVIVRTEKGNAVSGRIIAWAC